MAETNKQAEEKHVKLLKIGERKSLLIPLHSSSTGKPLDKSIPVWRGEEELLTLAAKWNSGCLTYGYAPVSIFPYEQLNKDEQVAEGGWGVCV